MSISNNKPSARSASGATEFYVHRPSFPPHNSFSSLSVRDLLDARDAYHVHLSSMRNILATAIGRYRIHENDWDASHAPEHAAERPEAPRAAEPKTLANTVVRSWSWPCVLVFVREWQTRQELGDQAVPRFLYLPDGRVVPTCVLHAPPDSRPPEPVLPRGNASGMLGGGYQCLRKSQGLDHAGTIACLVQRDGVYYALTNKHVAGADQDRVDALLRGERRTIGTTVPLSITKRLLSDIFPSWSAGRSLVNVDAALIRLEDASAWTAQVFGVGEVGEVFDATPSTVTLDLIGLPVRAFGAASGVVEGEIKALFFRYKSLGDQDYLADILVGPRPQRGGTDGDHPPASTETHPGDSGALWFYDPPSAEAERGPRSRRLPPIAMQWGGERVASTDGRTSSYALATFLSTVCRVLDVEVVHDWGTGYSEYWGKLAHFAIGYKACDLVQGTLGALMKANQANIGFPDQTLARGAAFKVGRDDFVALADVPDYVLLNGRPFEGQQHFADIDIAPPGHDQTILDACMADPTKVSATFWRDCFKAFKDLGCGPEEGSLPFRVWQLWDAMVDYLRAKPKPDLIRFVATAGIIAHYLGDASMPFHCSWLHHGYPPVKEVDGRTYPHRRNSKEYQAYSSTAAAKVHSIYDEGIFEVSTQAALSAVNDELPSASSIKADITCGWEAAVATVRLMAQTRKRLSAEDIIKLDAPTLKPKQRAQRLWGHPSVRDAAVKSLAASTTLLARIWASVWRVAGVPLPKEPPTFEQAQLKRIYKSPGFLESLDLDGYVARGTFEPPTESQQEPSAARSRSHRKRPKAGPRHAPAP